nr:DNA helicase [Tanacetum cinerariifolium]
MPVHGCWLPVSSAHLQMVEVLICKVYLSYRFSHKLLDSCLVLMVLHIFRTNSTCADTSISNHLKRTHHQTHSTLFSCQEAAFLKSANVSAIEITQPIHNEVTDSVFPATLGSSPVYDDLGDFDQQCHYYEAAFWYGQRFKGHQRGEKCSKNFPKKLTPQTFFEDKGHVHYQRRDTGVSTTKHQFNLDNNYVVLYNRKLLMAFQALINVQYCGWSMLIKYHFKYISKGMEKIFAWISKPLSKPPSEVGPSRSPIDEIQNYLEGRFVCAHEAYWIILKFDIHYREPAVQILSVHLQDMQRITFRVRDRLEFVVYMSLYGTLIVKAGHQDGIVDHLLGD